VDEQQDSIHHWVQPGEQWCSAPPGGGGGAGSREKQLRARQCTAYSKKQQHSSCPAGFHVFEQQQQQRPVCLQQAAGLPNQCRQLWLCTAHADLIKHWSLGCCMDVCRQCVACTACCVLTRCHPVAADLPRQDLHWSQPHCHDSGVLGILSVPAAAHPPSSRIIASVSAMQQVLGSTTAETCFGTLI
jgi:hypothetical protein